MRKVKSLIGWGGILFLLLAGLPALACGDCGDPDHCGWVEDLVVFCDCGREVIGTVTIDNDETDLKVTFKVTDLDWKLKETYVYASPRSPWFTCPTDGPPWWHWVNEGGDPAWDHTHTEFIPLEWSGKIYISAYAKVCTKVVEVTDLPDKVTETVASANLRDSIPDDSYYDTTVEEGSGFFVKPDGSIVYNGWCGDIDLPIETGTPYPAKVLSSYDPEAECLFRYPENLDLVNWILNQTWVGETSFMEPGTTFTYGDVQATIWWLLEHDLKITLGPWSPKRVMEILGAAYAFGEGFIPNSDEGIVIILIPVDERCENNIAQINLIKYKGLALSVSEKCCGSWAWGNAWFLYKCECRWGWGRYFCYEIKDLTGDGDEGEDCGHDGDDDDGDDGDDGDDCEDD